MTAPDATEPSAPFFVAPLADGPVVGEVSVPGSKSASARALVLAALADGPVKLTGILTARDTDLMRAGLASLGVGFEETASHLIVTSPTKWLPGGAIDIGLSGTVLRFLPPLAALADGPTRFFGDPEASHRPIKPLLAGLRTLGVQVTGDSLPFTVFGGLPLGHQTQVATTQSSQFLSGLLLAAPAYPEGLTVTATGSLPSAPHIEMTVRLLRHFGAKVTGPNPQTWRVSPGPLTARDLTIEPDLTNACVFLAAALATGGSVRVPWPTDTVQPAAQLLAVLMAFGGRPQTEGEYLTLHGPDQMTGVDVDLSEISELTCVVAALAALADRPSRIRGVGHIRGHETDRLAALATELTALGTQVTQCADGLEITPRPLRATRPFASYADHRMAHAGVLLGLHTLIEVDVACTAKTMPDFPNLWYRLIRGINA